MSRSVEKIQSEDGFIKGRVGGIKQRNELLYFKRG